MLKETRKRQNPGPECRIPDGSKKAIYWQEKRKKVKMQGASYSPTRLGLTWIPRNHVVLENILFSLPNSSLFLFKIYAFDEQM